MTSGVFALLLFILGFAFLLICAGIVFPLELVFYLAVGWGVFLYRIAGQIHPNWGEIALAFIALGLLFVGSHLFLGRLAHAWSQPKWKMRWTATGIITLLLLFVAGISLTALVHQSVWLMKESRIVARWELPYRVDSSNCLKRLGNAVLDSTPNSEWPIAGRFDETGRALHGWEAVLLPYLGETDLAQKVDMNIPWSAARNRRALQTPVAAFLNPWYEEDEDKSTAEGLAVAHYALNSRLVRLAGAVPVGEIPDGASSTILLGEIATEFPAWGTPWNWRDPARGINASPQGFGAGWRIKGCQFVYADGSTQLLNEDIDPAVLHALSTPSSGDKAF